MNPAIAPAIVAARVRLNDNPAAKPAAGANNVFTEAVRNTEKIFQNTSFKFKVDSCQFSIFNCQLLTVNYIFFFLLHLTKNYVFLPSQKRHFSSVGRATHS